GGGPDLAAAARILMADWKNNKLTPAEATAAHSMDTTTTTTNKEEATISNVDSAFSDDAVAAASSSSSSAVCVWLEVARSPAHIDLRVYTLFSQPPEEEEIEGEGDEDAPAVRAGTAFTLPHASMDNLWSNLYYPAAEKTRVLAHAESAMELARAGLDPAI